MAHFPAHFPQWLQTSISNMASSNDDTSYYFAGMALSLLKEHMLTVQTACLYHPSLSIPFTFLLSLSFTFFHPHFPSYTFHFLLSLTFIRLHLFSFTFILIHSTSFTFIHTHFCVIVFWFISLHRPAPLVYFHIHSPSSIPLAFIHLHPLHLPPLAFLYLLNPLHSSISISVDPPPSSIFISLHKPSFTFIYLR